MTKVYRQVPHGAGIRHRTILTDVPSHGNQIRMRQHAFLAEFVNDGVYNGLMLCGPVPFESMRMYHNGEAWIIDLEAEELRG